MPALPSLPNVLRIESIFRLEEDLHAKCRYFWKYLTGPPTTGELNTMAAALRVAFSSDLASVLSNGYSLIETIVTDMASPSGAQGNDTVAVPGTLSGPATLPADNCVLESRHVARRFRGGHSRIYWPFGDSSSLNDAQTWKSSFLTAVTTGLENYASAIDSSMSPFGGSGGPVAISYYEGFTVHTGTTGRARNVSTVRSTPIIDPVVGHTIQPGIATQRKRLLRLA